MDPNALALKAVNTWVAQMSESEQRRMIWGSVMAKDELVDQLTQTIADALRATERAVEQRVWEEAASKAHDEVLRMESEQAWCRSEHKSFATAKGMGVMAGRLRDEFRRCAQEGR